MVHVGIYFPKDTIKRVDERRGRYYSRNKYFLKVIEEYLNGHNELKNPLGSKVSTPPPTQAEASTNNTTTVHAAGTSEVDSLIDMATNGGHHQRLAGGDEAVANRKKVNTSV